MQLKHQLTGLALGLLVLQSPFHRAEAGTLVVPTLRRVALVMGNANYASAPLRAALKDSKDMAEVLKKRGFEVTLKENISNRAEMREAIQAFSQSLRQDNLALFYYSGHGIEVNNQEYLLPTGASIKQAADVEDEALNLNWVLAETAPAKARLFYLDTMFPQLATPTRGLSYSAKFTGFDLSLENTFVSFATTEMATDDPGRNGLYTQELLKAMQKPGLSVEQIDKEVRVNVSKLSQHRQMPISYSTLVEAIVLFVEPAVPTQR